MKDAIQAYMKRVAELADHVRGNEQATKKSLIEPLFVALGYDVTDPRECVPEHREDFGQGRSAKPVDYAFLRGGVLVFLVEAKDVSKKLTGYDEQLADYFAKCSTCKVGILTNGTHWRFFSDIDHDNVMDKNPFVEWDVLSEDPPPWDFLRLLEKAQFNVELIRTFAQRKREQNLLVDELSRLLAPAPEFIRLAIENIETRNLTAGVIEGWKPVLKAAIAEWAKQQRLSTVLSDPSSSHEGPDDAASRIAVDTTPEELKAFEVVQRLLGSDRPVVYEDTGTYFKIRLPEKRTWVLCRLYNFGHPTRTPFIYVSLPLEHAQPLVQGWVIKAEGPNWTSITLKGVDDIERMSGVLQAAWDFESQQHRQGREQDTRS
jgi:hypothetical protein